MSYPESYLFNEGHLWMRLEGEDEAVLGISRYAQEQLGEVLYIDVPEKGAEITKGVSFGTVESVKSASDLIPPVSGTVIESNQKLRDEPWLINQDPHEKGWIVRVRLQDAGQVKELLTAGAYLRYTGEGES